jgi:hypothetical protein
MKHTVVFSLLADHQLADIWLRATDRQQVTDAANHIEELLRHDPDRRGEARPNGWRILVVGPLAATFEVSADDRKVTVLSIRYNPSLGRP